MLKTIMRGLCVVALCAFGSGVVAQSHPTPVTGVPASIAAPAALPLPAVAYGAAVQPSSSSVAGDAVGATDARVAAPAAGEDGCFVINPTGNSGVDRGLLQGSGTLNLRACGAKPT